MANEKTELVSRLKTEREFFVDTISRLSNEQICNVQVIDHWTVKDIIAHVTAWELELLRWLESAERSQSPNIPEPGEWGPFIQEFNRSGYLMNRDRPLSEVLQDFKEVYERVLSAFQELPEDLDDPYWSVWYKGEPPWIMFGTYPEHYREHGEEISAAFSV